MPGRKQQHNTDHTAETGVESLDQVLFSMPDLAEEMAGEVHIYLDFVFRTPQGANRVFTWRHGFCSMHHVTLLI